ncbi:hypothetical protein D3C76_801120 [compost metagenome]
MFQTCALFDTQPGLIHAQQLQLQRRECRGQLTLHRRPLLTRGLLELANDQRLHTLGLIQVVGREALVEQADDGFGYEQQGAGIGDDDDQVQAHQNLQHAGQHSHSTRLNR